MRHAPRHRLNVNLAACLLVLFVTLTFGMADEPAELPKAYLDGTGTGWTALGENDFANVNGDAGTWTWKGDLVH